MTPRSSLLWCFSVSPERRQGVKLNTLVSFRYVCQSIINFGKHIMIRQLTLLSSCLFSSLALSNSGNNLDDYWQYEDFLAAYPTQKRLVTELAEVVSSKPISLTSTQLKPISITVIYPGQQVSDYWRRNLKAFEVRLDRLNIKYELNQIFTRPNLDIGQQKIALNEALIDKPDYIVFTLDSPAHRELIQDLLKHSQSKLILQNITTPVKSWKKQPFLYIGFDHVLGTKMLADYFKQAFPNGSRYSMLYFTEGYISSVRGEVFNELFQEPKRHNLSSFKYTDATRSSGYTMTKKLVSLDPDIDFIYACATDIALGAVDALEELGRQDIQVNGWGGGDAELSALEKSKLTATVMRLNDDTGIAMAEVIKSDIEGQDTPQVFSGKLKLITFDDNPTTIKRLKEQAFRYSKLE